MSTIALGPYKGTGVGSGGYSMYHWSYALSSGGEVTVFRILDGGSSAQINKVPTPSSSASPCWAGGEVDQLSGDILFTGYYASTLSSAAAYNTFRMMRYNPSTGAYVQSGPLVAASASDWTGISGARVSSDMRVFEAGVPDIGNSALTVTPATPIAADGAAYYTAVVTLRDANANPVAGKTVRVIVTGGVLSTSTPPGPGTAMVLCETDERGQCELYWSSMTAGIDYVLDAGTTFMIGTATRTFVAGEVSAAASAWTVSDDGPKTAGSSNGYTVTAYLRDANGNAVAASEAATLSFGIDADNHATAPQCVIGTYPAPIGDDQPALVCTSIWTSPSSGTKTITAKVGGNTLNQPQASYGREFQAGAVDPGNSNLTVTPATTVVADGIAYYTAVVTLKDAGDNVVPGETVTMEVSGGVLTAGAPPGASTITLTCETNSQGQCELYWSSTVAGTDYVLEASVQATPIGAATRSFSAGTASADASAWTVSDDGPKTAGSTDGYTVTAYLRDANGNAVVASEAATLSFGIDADNRTTTPQCVVGSYPAPIGDGQPALVCTSTWTSTSPGSKTITAQVDGMAMSQSQGSYIREFQVAVALRMLKIASSDTLRVGQTFIYTLRYTNDGSVDATVVNFKDRVPDGIDITAVSPAATCTPATPTDASPFVGNGSSILSCSVVVTVPANAAGTADVTLTAKVMPEALGHRPVNVASWASDGDEDPQDPYEGCTQNCTSNPEPNPVENGADLSMTKSIRASDQPLSVGQTFHYDFVFTNSGTGDATEVRFADRVPEGIEITRIPADIACSVGGVPVNALQGDGVSVLTCTANVTVVAGHGSPGPAVTVTLEARPNAAASGKKPVNRATWSEGGTTDPPPPDPGNCTADPRCTDDGGPTDPIDGDVKLSMRKQIDGQPLAVGRPFNYVFVFTNSGQSDASQVTFSDRVPVGITITAPPAGGTCSGGQLPLAGDGSTVLTCTVMVAVPAQAAAEVAVLLPAVPNAAALGQKPVNHASWTNDGGGTPPTPGPGGCTTNCTDDGGPTDPVGNGASLSMRKQIEGEPLRVGKPFHYLFTFSNNGAGDAAQVSFADLVPSGMTIIEAPAGATCTLDGVMAAFPIEGDGARMLACDVAVTVAANGGTVTVKLAAEPNAAATGLKPVNHASWSPDGVEPPENPGQGICRIHCTDDGGPTMPVEPDSEGALRIVKRAAVREARIGDLVRYSLMITNVGDVDVADFRVIDMPSAAFSYVDGSASTNDDTVLTVSGNGPIEFGGLSLKAGREVQLVYMLRVGAGVRPGRHTNTVQAYSGAASEARTSLSNRATADVIVADNDPMLDESLILGTVYHDRDGDGMQDRDEPGIAGVRLATVEGLLIETDQYGRFHLEGVTGSTNGAAHGRNFVVKVDPSTLPGEATFTTDNPLLRRITPGLPVRFDFGVRLEDEGSMPSPAGSMMEMEVSDAFFVEDRAQIKEQHHSALDWMMQMIKQQNMNRVVLNTKADHALAQRRVIVLAEEIKRRLGYEIEVVLSTADRDADQMERGD